MTILERRKYRDEVLQRELARAVARAEGCHLSYPCRKAMDLSRAGVAPGVARQFHASCEDEEAGGKGCLCPCHDVREASAGEAAHGLSHETDLSHRGQVRSDEP
jgi:hypothetical protein